MNLPLKSQLADKKGPAWGCWLTLPSTAVARQLASIPEMSWVLIDAEHGLINDTHLYDLANSVASAGASPIIRVPIDEAWWIKRALDAGAHGLMIPMAHDADIVKKVVAAAKYPPHGIRGFGPMFTHATGSIGLDYAKKANDDLLVLVQIESRQGVENIDEILAVDGLDLAFIGPFDLAFSLGVEPGSAEHEAAIEKILQACKRAGKPAAIFCGGGDIAARRREQGFDMISVAVDIDSLAAAFQAHIATAKGSESAAKPSGGYASK